MAATRLLDFRYGVLLLRMLLQFSLAGANIAAFFTFVHVFELWH